MRFVCRQFKCVYPESPKDNFADTKIFHTFVRFFKMKIMSLAGIKYMKDADGRHRYVRIDLDKYGKHPLLEDFLDGLEAEAETSKGEPSKPLREFISEQNKKRGINV